MEAATAIAEKSDGRTIPPRITYVWHSATAAGELMPNQIRRFPPADARGSIDASMREASEQARLLMFLSARHRAVAERLGTLVGEPDEPRLSTKSLRNLAAFLATYTELASPVVGIGGDGCVHSEWRTVADGLIVMVFLDDDSVRFAELSSPDAPSVTGTCRREDVLATLRSLPLRD